MEEPKVVLGGMALTNGVLVHGPTSWACAVRLDDGTLKVVAEPKKLIGSKVRSPFLRGPARLAEAFAVLPSVRRAVPEARFPFQRPLVGLAMLGSALGVRALRNSGRVRPVAQEVGGLALTAIPAALGFRGSEIAAYHGAEHITIGSYEHGEPRPREHERCGTHLLAPLLGASFVTSLAVSRLPAASRPLARIFGQLVAVGAAVESYGWALRNRDHPLSKAMTWPGHELQHRFATKEPTPEQLEVAEAALAACLELELETSGAGA